MMEKLVKLMSLTHETRPKKFDGSFIEGWIMGVIWRRWAKAFTEKQLRSDDIITIAPVPEVYRRRITMRDIEPLRRRIK